MVLSRVAPTCERCQQVTLNPHVRIGPRPARNAEAVGQVSPQQGVTVCLKLYL